LFYSHFQIYIYFGQKTFQSIELTTLFEFVEEMYFRCKEGTKLKQNRFIYYFARKIQFGLVQEIFTSAISAISLNCYAITPPHFSALAKY